ncbi:sensor histidine kinase [Clostridium sp. OM05-6BH]|uniref:sensor histidine kinase n=1 Tax=unclassified Clostridium TaxID=2614128 RepID=UPI000E4A6723|nr:MULTISPECIES: HAMP domain-containing sensor histidine kinase [unclassified Clostridium]RHV12597.1 sensor histidine kinase [Clostridium sp. OM05-9BH]RHV18167.1 sensor histidine kinase [Clostridium sp. OM05-6BH]
MKKMRLKMIGIVFASVVAAFMVMTIILVMCFGAYRNRQADQITAMISENNGTVPQLKDYKQQQKNSQAFERYFNNYNEDSSYRTRFFRIFLDEDKKVTNVNMDHIAAVDEKRAVRMTKIAMLRRGKVGLVGSYRYRKEYKDGQVRSIIFLDCKENQSFYHLAVTITITVSTLLTCLITVIFAIASKRAVRPFEINSNRQKQFITDASHELKTPLAIISANAEVLQYKGDGNEWTQNIIDQTKHMGKLINQLLVLAKLDEVQEKSEKQEADLKLLLEETTRPFEEVATQKKVTLKLHLEEGVTIRVNREQIAQLVSILTENAAKYVNDGGKIVWRLTKTQHGAVLVVKNTTEKELPDTKRMFDRFYRSDSSRSSKTGGQGIGLSIAKKIVDSHKGSITAKAGDGMVTFRVSLPK